jgi:two-component sensor histidine kinase
MSAEATQFGRPVISSAASARTTQRSVASYEFEIAEQKRVEAALRGELARDVGKLHERDEQIQQQAASSSESTHRLLNALQIIGSLLSMQSRASANADTASQLAVAAQRVAIVSRVHRRLQDLNWAGAIAFTDYLKEACQDYCAMLSSHERPEQIVVDAIDVELSPSTAIPLAFIVNELITNAAKHGGGHIGVELKRMSPAGFALSVSNDGPALPEGFDPSASSGMGMTIVQAFVEQIGAKLRFGRGEGNQGARFSVVFAEPSQRGGGPDRVARRDPASAI